MKLALTLTPDATVTVSVKTTVPYGFTTCIRTEVPAGRLGVVVTVMVPVWAFR